MSMALFQLSSANEVAGYFLISEFLLRSNLSERSKQPAIGYLLSNFFRRFKSMADV